MITVPEAGAVLGLPPASVHELVRSGALPVAGRIEHRRALLFERAAVERLAAGRRRAVELEDQIERLRGAWHRLERGHLRVLQRLSLERARFIAERRALNAQIAALRQERRALPKCRTLCRPVPRS